MLRLRSWSTIMDLRNIEQKILADAFIKILDSYLNPAFGSLSKRDIDLLLFMKLQEINYIDKNADIYDLVSKLRITRSKARNLLYESKLRSSTEEHLDKELIEILSWPIIENQTNTIKIEIDNPYLRDHLKAKMKKLRLLSDGSFSQEIITFNSTSLSILIEKLIPDDRKAIILRDFERKGYIDGSTLSKLIKSIFGNIGKKALGKFGEELGEDLHNILIDLFNEQINPQIIIEKIDAFNQKSRS